MRRHEVLIEALGKLAESLAKFTESLVNAGPAIAALVASMVSAGCPRRGALTF